MPSISLTLPLRRVYAKHMRKLLLPAQIIAIIYGLFVAFLALVGSFADGDDVFARFLLTLLHPLSAVGLLAAVFMRNLAVPVVGLVAALLLVTALADGYYAMSIAAGSIKGDWEIPAILAIGPTLGFLYAMSILLGGKAPADES